jgi:hypothetical protein
VNKCKDCKHWGESGGYEESAELRFCKAVPHYNASGIEPSADIHDDYAGVQDGSGYSANLLTGPEFGCIKWEAKQ